MIHQGLIDDVINYLRSQGMKDITYVGIAGASCPTCGGELEEIRGIATLLPSKVSVLICKQYGKGGCAGRMTFEVPLHGPTEAQEGEKEKR